MEAAIVSAPSEKREGRQRKSITIGMPQSTLNPVEHDFSTAATTF
jgi:hypothetical protein